MPGTFFGLEIARRGLKVHQHALDITGHNLANASTPGYSRQEAVIRVTDPYTNPGLNSSVTPGQFGSGVGVDSIRRIKDEYLDNGVRQAVTATGYWQDQINFLQRAEAAFGEPATTGIGDRIVDFFKAWMNLNNNPQDDGAKAAVVELGNELATLMSSTYKQLEDIEKSIASDPGTGLAGSLADQVNRINDIITQISDLTTQIKKIYALGQQPNDLLDNRDQLLEELSEYAPVKVERAPLPGSPTGEITKIFLFDSTFEIDINNPQQFNISFNAAKEVELVYGTDPSAPSLNLTQKCDDAQQGGSLLGLEYARQNVTDFRTMLNQLAVKMKEEIAKTMFSANYDPSDPSTDPSNDPSFDVDEHFFEGDLGSHSFKVIKDLSDNPGDLDGTKAGDVASLRDKNITALKGNTFEQYYGLLVTEVGSGVKSAGGMAENQAAISKQIIALRDSVSGVSIDEELTRMVQFQYGFQASARVINTLDSMLDVIINRLF
ncbi:flagellar hook-associated protein FlgK [Desulfallas sp. Bu1-1]|uniref:flagellar hook-associated protein FlgK n=1 Tax=Desulfallas sp. Bu1-1 TaxID=2787620 RepID=UPI00189E3C17|nr:flagellar hook-associated protein FlgK [Desulfallas sp. Bu1-1]MBF7081986.1 flagellar hook-associated protein FlgK [Desulfallas sp. Bu1-1]